MKCPSLASTQSVQFILRFLDFSISMCAYCNLYGRTQFFKSAVSRDSGRVLLPNPIQIQMRRSSSQHNVVNFYSRRRRLRRRRRCRRRRRRCCRHRYPNVEFAKRRTSFLDTTQSSIEGTGSFVRVMGDDIDN